MITGTVRGCLQSSLRLTTTPRPLSFLCRIAQRTEACTATAGSRPAVLPPRKPGWKEKSTALPRHGELSNWIILLFCPTRSVGLIQACPLCTCSFAKVVSGFNPTFAKREPSISYDPPQDHRNVPPPHVSPDISYLCRRCKRAVRDKEEEHGVSAPCDACGRNPELAYVTQAAATGLTQLATTLKTGKPSEQRNLNPVRSSPRFGFIIVSPC